LEVIHHSTFISQLISNAIKARGAQETLIARDIAELVAESMGL